MPEGLDRSYQEEFRAAFSAPQLPGPAKPTYPIVRAKPGDPGIAFITSPHAIEVHKHFRSGVSYPCNRTKHCPLCVRRWSKRPMFYLCGLTSGRKHVPCIIELTEGALRSCPVLADPKTDLRGMKITLTKEGDSKFAPVTATVQRLDANGKPMRVPDPFALEFALLNLWGNPYEIIDTDSGKIIDATPTTVMTRPEGDEEP